ncbi:hypothetical protein [Variovorax paradoxus]|uniref:hypothetical protein n=1 Tax=Variovorax paradoxus TaxID=34073 RepID=UPI001ABCD44A
MSSSSRAWLRLAGAMLAIGLLAALAAAIHEAGATRERLVWQGREAQRNAAAAEALRKEYERGRAASTRYQLDAGALQTRYLALEGISHELRQRVALVLPPVTARDRPDRVPRGAQAPAPLPHDAIEAAPPGPVGDDRHRLSLAAVWMWNSALAGTDVPAGACGSADTSDAACAADSGLAVDDAWDNQRLNARACAADRLRHAALIEFLTQRPVP